MLWSMHAMGQRESLPVQKFWHTLLWASNDLRQNNLFHLLSRPKKICCFPDRWGAYKLHWKNKSSSLSTLLEWDERHASRRNFDKFNNQGYVSFIRNRLRALLFVDGFKLVGRTYDIFERWWQFCDTDEWRPKLWSTMVGIYDLRMASLFLMVYLRYWTIE